MKSIDWAERPGEPARPYILVEGVGPAHQPARGDARLPVLIGRQQVIDICARCRQYLDSSAQKGKHEFYKAKLAAFAPLLED